MGHLREGAFRAISVGVVGGGGVPWRWRSTAGAPHLDPRRNTAVRVQPLIVLGISAIAVRAHIPAHVPLRLAPRPWRASQGHLDLSGISRISG